MNYLAHLYLAGDRPASLVGSLMGDFVRGRLDQGFPHAIRQGIWLHRKIDAFTDAHPIVRRSRERISPAFRRYGAILVDVFYDHYLARDWAHYSRVSLQEFSRSVYAVLWDYYWDMPAAMQRSVAYMVANDLLVSYREFSGVSRSLRGIESRLKRASRLSEALADLEGNYQLLANDFAAFFPELRRYVERIAALPESTASP